MITDTVKEPIANSFGSRERCQGLRHFQKHKTYKIPSTVGFAQLNIFSIYTDPDKGFLKVGTGSGKLREKKYLCMYIYVYIYIYLLTDSEESNNFQVAFQNEWNKVVSERFVKARSNQFDLIGVGHIRPICQQEIGPFSGTRA